MDNQLFELPKGGILLKLTDTYIQLGVPPESIKDSINIIGTVPLNFILPAKLFSYERMCSFAELEFPIYYNFFVNKKKTTIFATREQEDILSALLEESIFGPKELFLEYEFPLGKETAGFPDMKKELSYFATNTLTKESMIMDDLVDFIELTDNAPISITDKAKLLYNKNEETIIITDGDFTKELNRNIEIKVIDAEKIATDSMFVPPVFGITTLGSSHGFDPKGKTSGFIFWINGSGIMIDPPIDSSLWLIEQNVDPCMVKSVILTHCHADHDSGVMQKILQEGRIKLYTTPTILKSFIKKTSLITGIPETDLIDLIDFIPITIGVPTIINGAEFIFSYRLHSIPTIGFELCFKGKNIVYTSDHLNDQNYFENLFKAGILPESRYLDLKSFDWNKDLVIHEAGVPPIHTPMETLLKLDDKIKANILLVHVDKSTISKNSGFHETLTGLNNTLIIDIDYSSNLEAVQILNFISGIDIFDNLSFEKSGEFLSLMKYRKFKKNECLIKEGEQSKRFFILLSGRASLYETGKFKAYLVSGSYFGESSIVWDKPSIDTITANTDLITITIERNEFISFIMGTPLLNNLKKLDTIRREKSYTTLSKNPLFNSMTIIQKNHLEYIMEYCLSKKGDVIMEAGKPVEYAVIWQSGNGLITDSCGNSIESLMEGDYIGSLSHLLRDELPETGIIADSDSTYFRIKWDRMIRFLKKNPRIYMEIKNSDRLFF